MSLYLGNNLISGVATPVEGARNIGQIVTSTIPLTDAGLHLLDGSLIQGGGSYDDFVDYISELVTDYPDLFCTEADWQTSVTTYGVCGKFVYDSVNNTVRLPKWGNNSYIGTNTLPIKGTGMTLGMTNNVEYFGIGKYGSDFYGSTTFYGLNASLSSSSNDITNCSMGVTTDATKSGIVTDLSNNTGYYYIVIATSTKTDIQVDIDEIATDLNGKADVDLSNINASQSAKNTIVAWGMPDYSAGVSISTTQTINLNYDALLVWYKSSSASSTTNISVYKGTDTSGIAIGVGGQGSTGGGYYSLTLPLCKNEVYSIVFNGSAFVCQYFPLKGAS